MYEDKNIKFAPNYLRNPVLNGQVDINPRLRTRHTDFSSLPTTMLPAQTDGKLDLCFINNKHSIIRLLFRFNSKS